jgi:Tol biopolymer transport system component
VVTSSRFAWFDRAGRSNGTWGEEAAWLQFSISTDGGQVLAARSEPRLGVDLWLIDVQRGFSSRLTSEPGAEGDPIWSPDGRYVAFTRTPKGVANIFKRSVASGEETLLLESSQATYSEDWSRDGKFLAYHRNSRAIEILPLTGDSKPLVFVEDRFSKDEPHFSPDGRWLAYESDESGQIDVYVQPFPGPGPKIRVSPSGGGGPRWRKDGRELFYLTQDGFLMAVPLKVGATLVPGVPQRLFKTPIPAVQLTIDQYDVAPDGQRFLFQVPVGTAAQAPITVVLNWAATLRK